jgi:hypothetical protein
MSAEVSVKRQKQNNRAACRISYSLKFKRHSTDSGGMTDITQVDVNRYRQSKRCAAACGLGRRGAAKVSTPGIWIEVVDVLCASMDRSRQPGSGWKWLNEIATANIV